MTDLGFEDRHKSIKKKETKKCLRGGTGKEKEELEEEENRNV